MDESRDRLGPLPEPAAWFRAPYGTLEPNPLFRVTGPQSLEWSAACYTEDQLRAAVAAERERWRAALEYAISEADGWHDDCHGGAIESEQMDAARALLLA